MAGASAPATSPRRMPGGLPGSREEYIVGAVVIVGGGLALWQRHKAKQASSAPAGVSTVQQNAAGDATYDTSVLDSYNQLEQQYQQLANQVQGLSLPTSGATQTPPPPVPTPTPAPAPPPSPPPAPAPPPPAPKPPPPTSGGTQWVTTDGIHALTWYGQNYGRLGAQTLAARLRANQPYDATQNRSSPLYKYLAAGQWNRAVPAGFPLKVF